MKIYLESRVCTAIGVDYITGIKNNGIEQLDTFYTDFVSKCWLNNARHLSSKLNVKIQSEIKTETCKLEFVSYGHFIITEINN